MIEVPPGGVADVSYTIKVPEDEALVGTYWSILMVEVVAPQPLDLAAVGADKLSLGINQIVRYAVQVVTHIGESGDRRLNFLDTRLLRDAQARILQLDIENTGSRWLRPTVSAELYSDEGRLAHSFEGETLRVYPGTSVRYRLDLSDAKPGKYKAVVIADCGGDDVFGATYSVVFHDEDYYAIR
jgi:hypothetical protein